MDGILSELFGAPEIPFEWVKQLQNDAPNIIIWAAPAMFLFVLLEWYISRRQNKHLYEKKETIGAICVGVGNVIINTALKMVLFYLIVWFYNQLPWRMYMAWWTFIPSGMAIALVAFGLSMINYGMDEITNPRLRAERDLNDVLKHSPIKVARSNIGATPVARRTAQ